MSDFTVIRLSGELEIGRKTEVAQALQLTGTEGGIIVDFFEVTYADSTTLAELLRFRSEAAARKIPVAIVIGSRQFSRLIQYAGLSDAFAVFDDPAAAAAFLASKGAA